MVSFPPGGADDAHGRLVAEKPGELLGRQIIVDNRPGAGGVIGQDTAAKAAPDGYTLLIAGSSIVIKVDMSFATMGSSIGIISGGKLRPLAVTSSARSKLLPDVPTMIEGGLPGNEMTSWYALFAPAATPREIVSQLNAAVVTAVASPDLQERLRKIGSEPTSSTPEQMSQRLRNDATTLTRIVKAAGIKEE